MIQITPIAPRQLNFMLCGSCESDDQVRQITVGLDERSTASIQLCRRCMAELKTSLGDD